MARLLLLLGAVSVALAGCGGDNKPQTQASTPAPATAAALPGAQITGAPWNRGADQLQQRLGVLGLPALPAEGQVLHIHQHLDMFVEGKRVTVPAGIGIGETFISPLHTHDASGLLHVESDRVRAFTLGQVFGVWGVPLSRDELGGLKAGGGKELRAWVNGKPFRGDPGEIELAEHQELVIAYGTAAQMPKPVPSRYAFQAGE
jgi:hypothetical protein